MHDHSNTCIRVALHCMDYSINPYISCNFSNYSTTYNLYQKMLQEYKTESAKWRAYQLMDPLADGVFWVGNTQTMTFCNPSCDASDPLQDISLVRFFFAATDAIDAGYAGCAHCVPLAIDSQRQRLIAECLSAINNDIGFNPPNEVLLEDDGNSSATNNHVVAVVACRHIAAAAAASVVSSPSSPENSRKRRKRGGVVGFKELAAKSRLSPWHFHRVFKSITGLTPKAYGDKCQLFFSNYEGGAGGVNASWAAAKAAEGKSKNGSLSSASAAGLAVPESPTYTPQRHSIITMSSASASELDPLENISPISSYQNSMDPMLVQQYDNFTFDVKPSQIEHELAELLKTPAPKEAELASPSSLDFNLYVDEEQMAPEALEMYMGMNNGSSLEDDNVLFTPNGTGLAVNGDMPRFFSDFVFI